MKNDLKNQKSKKYIYTNQALAVFRNTLRFTTQQLMKDFFKTLSLYLNFTLFMCDIRVSTFTFTQHNTNTLFLKIYQTAKHHFTYFAYDFHNSIVSLSIIAQFL